MMHTIQEHIAVKQEVQGTHTLRCRLTEPREQREEREGEKARDERAGDERGQESEG